MVRRRDVLLTCMVALHVTFSSAFDVPFLGPAANVGAPAVGVNPSECRSLMDLYLVIDGSDSISTADFLTLQKAIGSFVPHIDLGPLKARIGMLVYSSTVTSKHPFSFDLQYLTKAAATLTHPRDGTNTALGIEHMVQMFQQHGRPNVPWVCVTLTDGISKDTVATQLQAKLAAKNGISMFAVGIGHKIDRLELGSIASSQKQVMAIDNFSQLADKLTSMMTTICPCPIPATLQYAKCNDGARAIGTVRNYLCQDGYLQRGNGQITCRDDFTWTPLDTTFACVPCGETPLLKHATCGGGDFTLGAVRQFLCDPGYLAVGDPMITCDPTAQWTAPQFQCIPCGPTPILQHGTCGGGDFTLGAVRQFLCDPGYLAVGDPTITCDPTAQWTLPQFQCIPCGETPLLKHGTCGGGDFTLGAVRQFLCDPGYLAVGDPMITCDPTAQWTIPQFQCIPCGPTPTLQHGTCGGGDFTLGAQRQFLCDPGYLAVGDPMITCDPTAQWTAPQFQCIPCGETPLLKHGTCGGGDFTLGAVRQFLCDPGYLAVGDPTITCDPTAQWTIPQFQCIPCGPTPTLQHGTCGGGDYTLGAVRQFLCDPGYLAVGDPTITCDPTAQWTIPQFQCIPCGPTPTLQHGTCGGGDFTLGAVRQFLCDPGYLAVGDPMITCDPTAQWTIPQFQCIPCGPTPTLQHGTCGGGDYTLGAVRQFLCDPGYLAVGDPTITCDPTAQWTIPQFQCIPCGETPILKHGTCGGGDFTLGAVRQFLCDPGYLAVGDPMITCDPTAQWTAPQFQCIPCGETPLLKHATCGGGDYTLGAVRQFLCDPGYLAVGDPMITCDPTAQWTAPQFQCIPCGPTPTLQHGTCGVGDFTLGAQRQFLCDPGYLAVGDPMITCDPTAQWTAPQFQCIPCGETPLLKHATCGGGDYTLGAVRQFLCDPGYLAVGDPMITCDPTAQWTAPQFQCIPCGPTPTLQHGTCGGGDFTLGAVRQFLCDPGYLAVGDPMITCDPTAQWTAPQFQCIPCGETPILKHGTCGGGDFTLGAQRQFLCDPGYLAVGDPMITCDPTAQWTAPQFQCIPCGETPLLKHGTCGGGDFTLGAQRQFLCDPGYLAVGDPMITCDPTAQWTLPQFQCIPCGPTPTLQHGTCGGGDFTLGAQRQFLCDPGYLAVGDPTITCDPTAQWTAPQFQCIPCGPTPTLQHGTCGGGDFTLGAQRQFLCDPGYLAVGDPMITCDPTAQWTAPQFQCIPCGPTPTLQHGTCGGGDFTLGAQRQFLCDPGYLAVGDPMITCDPTAQWTTPQFQCIPCGDTPLLKHGTCGGGDYTLGATRTYVCDTGYATIGNADIQCLPDATWSQPQLQCSPCGDTPVIAHAECGGGDVLVGSLRSYSCLGGYIPQGSPDIRCLNTGMWSEPTFKCMDCGNPPLIPNAYTGIGPATVGSTLEYMCEPGYDMHGRGRITCLANGLWEKPNFACNVKTTTTTTHRPPVVGDPSVCDACRFINGVGYNNHPFDCNQYVQCFVGARGMESVYRRCPFGLFWDQNVLTCRPSEQVDCPWDKCKIPGVTSYKHTDPNSCCSYWKCHNGYAIGDCCGNGFSYHAATQSCVQDFTCTITCAYEDEIPICDKRPTTRDTMYEQHIGNNIWVSMHCAPGTAYNPVDCECSLLLMMIPGKKRQQVCKPELYLPFTTGFGDNSGKHVYIVPENVSIHDGAAVFNGNSRILVNRFSNTEFTGDLVIKFRYNEFKDGEYYNQLQALVTNGDCGSDPSIVVAKMPGYVLLGAKTDVAKSFALPTLEKTWKEVIYIHNEKKLEGRVCGASMSKWSYGSIQATHCAIQVGQGHGLQSYVGLIDDLYIYQCRPRSAFLSINY